MCFPEAAGRGGGQEGVAIQMGEWYSLAALDIMGSPGFGCELWVLGSRRSNTEERPDP